MTQNKFWLLQRDTEELGAGVRTASLNQTQLFHHNLLEFRGRFPVFVLLLVDSDETDVRQHKRVAKCL